jgi:(1->4)-alpha-D-glucan 1-alpha-D-glucosylmutase
MREFRSDSAGPGYRVPASTYRLQLTAQFSFEDAFEITDYLQELGITDCYASPILTARPGSSHGYDVCKPSELNPRLGGSCQFDRWTERLRALGMGLLLDIVPNHMAADPLNPWWRSVLQHGPASEFASWFDIDWDRTDPGLRGKVLLPILEDHYWKVLEAGKLQLVAEADQLAVAYHQTRLPLSPESLQLLHSELTTLCRKSNDASESPCDREALDRLLKGFSSLTRDPASPSAKAEHGTEVNGVLSRLLKHCNGEPGQPDSFGFLHSVLQRQHYRLAYWRTGNEELNYRRFFDVAELAAVRMELPEVFEAAHELVLRLVAEGKVTGLRVDHPDGLRDPHKYFARLQEAIGQIRAAGSPEAANPNELARGQAFFVVAEKILTRTEPLPPDWRVAGTTGYDFLNLLNGVFLNRANGAALDQIYGEFTGSPHNFERAVYESKLRILHRNMLADLRRLTVQLKSIASNTQYGIDFSTSELRECIANVIAAFPVYRTYLTEERLLPNAEERAQIEAAVKHAAAISDSLDPEVFLFLQKLLLGNFPEDLDDSGRQQCLEFVLRFQQLTGPAMAKGLEDTTFYSHNRFIALNEVGGAPDHFGTTLDSFHQQNASRAEHWPHTMLATSTHDTKRGEDLRARLNVLSEMPEEWRQAVLKWKSLNHDKKRLVNGAPAPDANDEYFLYQVLVGAWVSAAENGNDSRAFRDRIAGYMLKALREAKAHTSWTEPNEAYEEATQQFVHAILSHEHADLFLNDFMLFQRKVAFFGLFNSLAQVILKMTVPGVPDFYQGTELWDYNLVDPDNRRSVDYRLRKTLLADLRRKFTNETPDAAQLIKDLLKNYQTGQIKQYVIWRMLEYRRRHRDLFESGGYDPIRARGSKPDHICAFVRSRGEESVVVIAARLVLGLTQGAQRGALESDVWQTTSLNIPGSKQGERYRNVLTGQVIELRGEPAIIPVPELLGLLPAAVLKQIG